VIKLDACLTIIDEDEFLRVTLLQTKGNPESATVRAAVHLLKKYRIAKELQKETLCNEKSEKQNSNPEVLRSNSTTPLKQKEDQLQMKLL